MDSTIRYAEGKRLTDQANNFVDWSMALAYSHNAENVPLDCLDSLVPCAIVPATRKHVMQAIKYFEEIIQAGRRE